MHRKRKLIAYMLIAAAAAASLAATAGTALADDQPFTVSNVFSSFDESVSRGRVYYAYAGAALTVAQGMPGQASLWRDASVSISIDGGGGTVISYGGSYRQAQERVPMPPAGQPLTLQVGAAYYIDGLAGAGTASIYVFERNPMPGASEGAAPWAAADIESSMRLGLMLEAMRGRWAEPTSRLLAAEAMHRLIDIVPYAPFAGGPAESRGHGNAQLILADKGLSLSRFSDTQSDAAAFLRAAGISEGTGGGSYGPGGTFTRAQLVTMLGRMAENIYGEDLSAYPAGSEIFADVSAGSHAWADRYIGWAASIGLTQGVSENAFNPGGTLTNQETAVFMHRAYNMFYRY